MMEKHHKGIMNIGINNGMFKNVLVLVNYTFNNYEPHSVIIIAILSLLKNPNTFFN